MTDDIRGKVPERRPAPLSLAAIAALEPVAVAILVILGTRRSELDYLAQPACIVPILVVVVCGVGGDFVRGAKSRVREQQLPARERACCGRLPTAHEIPAEGGWAACH